MRNYCLLVVVGIFDLDATAMYFWVPTSRTTTPTSTQVLPVDIHVCAGELLTDHLLDSLQYQLTQRAAKVICRYGNDEITIFYAVHMDVCD